MKNRRDEYLLHKTPLHSFQQYVTAHQLAGDLELEEKAKPPPPESDTVLERLARERNNAK